MRRGQFPLSDRRIFVQQLGDGGVGSGPAAVGSLAEELAALGLGPIPLSCYCT